MSLVPCQNLGQRQLLQSRDKMNNAEYNLNNLCLRLQRLDLVPLPLVPVPCPSADQLLCYDQSVRWVWDAA